MIKLHFGVESTATTLEGYGDYFAWGEIKLKTIYIWDTYKYGETYDKLTKYCSYRGCGKNVFLIAKPDSTQRMILQR